MAGAAGGSAASVLAAGLGDPHGEAGALVTTGATFGCGPGSCRETANAATTTARTTAPAATVDGPG